MGKHNERCNHTLHHVDKDLHFTGSWTEELSVPDGRFKIVCSECGKLYGYEDEEDTQRRHQHLETMLREEDETGSSSLVQNTVQAPEGPERHSDPPDKRKPIDFNALKATVGIAQVLELIDYTPRKKRGAQLRGPCPVHKSTSETSTIFSVNLERNIYKCFSCDSEGDQFKLYAEVTGLPIYEAAKELAEKTGNEIPYKRH